jgi:hypothetical protein
MLEGREARGAWQKRATRLLGKTEGELLKWGNISSGKEE